MHFWLKEINAFLLKWKQFFDSFLILAVSYANEKQVLKFDIVTLIRVVMD